MAPSIRLLPLAALLLVACPQVTSAPCDDDAECPTGRCRRGACGPECLDDGECERPQVCSEGACVAPPECGADTDCAPGFVCRDRACACTADSACAANQACTGGRCDTRARCTSDAACPTPQRCELAAGLCLSPCDRAVDCAPGVDPLIAEALYVCSEGACVRRCVGDATCGAGLICENNLCARAECETLADCPAGQYCSSATFGRCLEYQPCASSAECPADHTCRTFPEGQCPPGFDCARKLCLELPRCFADGDCARPGYCERVHCQTTKACLTGAECPGTQTCIALQCVPKVCRGLGDCPAGQACADGTCTPAPASGDVDGLALTPTRGVLQVGDALDFTLVAFRLDRSSHALPQASFGVFDVGGSPSAAATVDAAGHLVAVSPGTVRVRGWVDGSSVPPREATLEIYPAPGADRRVLVLDAATRQPLADVAVRGCAGGCATSDEQITDARGVALFAGLGAGAATFSAAAPPLRTDGLPLYERASVVGTSAADVALPLWPNPVEAAAGFRGTISFTQVSSAGRYWAGFAALSMEDLPGLDLRTFLGEPFTVTAPGLPVGVPVPGSAVLFTSPGLGLVQAIKGTSYGLGEPGSRSAVAFAARTELDAPPRSLDLLAYASAFDLSLEPSVTVPSRPRIPDANDLDRDGRCADPSTCPAGTETIPDYGNLAALATAPNRPQRLRTEVALNPLPAAFDTALVAALQSDLDRGYLPLGLSSRAAGAPVSGERPVPAFTLQSGAPYAGLEVGHPTIWAAAIAAANALPGTLATSGSTSARLLRTAALPARAVVPPFLPVPSASSYAATTRVFSPGQPRWNEVASAGATVARLSLVGTENRHTVYFALSGSQTSVPVPTGPVGVGADPAGESEATLSVVALALQGAASADALFTLGGENLLTLPRVLEGYARFQP